MIVFDSNNSPFLVLWYFYLAFLSVIIVVNIVALMARGYFTWRAKRLLALPRKKGTRR